MPMGKLDFLGGYALAFGVVAAVQSALAVGAQRRPARARRRRARSGCSTVVAVADAVLGTALGLFVSAFAQTEFQAVQFMPALVIPQILLCGLFVPRSDAARRARGDQQRAAAVVRRRRDADADATADTGEVWRRPRGSSALRGRRARPRRGHLAAAYRLAGVRWLAHGSLWACPCSASRCCCSPAARGSRSSSAPCRSRRASSRSYVPGETTEAPSTRPPRWSTTASRSPSTSSARTPSTPSRPTRRSRRTSTSSSSSRRAG